MNHRKTKRKNHFLKNIAKRLVKKIKKDGKIKFDKYINNNVMVTSTTSLN